MRAKTTVPLLVMAILFLSMTPASAQEGQAGPPRRIVVERRAAVITFNLTVLGEVPADAQFGVYVQTEPPTPDTQTHYWFCANGMNEPTAFCGPQQPAVVVSGQTMTYSVSWPMAKITDQDVTIVFRYDRVVRGDGQHWPGQWQTFHEGRVTVARGDQAPTISMTYGYDLGVPDTAMEMP